eukprot:gnl/TRDRNA2_/TRDRNA2_65781_c0_seq1.p1 gnl/TRDRNA2_/TRDRNA2_65781_c0~~gnl/TRDRNA2_/TRDRNA2_65781_c0_seq1.p1  ORF type:complete len:106 (-),score=18.58 gnl/TRDRNA2_/TRDRNA2_65781_c0_seq1:107-424(-)
MAVQASQERVACADQAACEPPLLSSSPEQEALAAEVDRIASEIARVRKEIASASAADLRHHRPSLALASAELLSEVQLLAGKLRPEATTTTGVALSQPNEFEVVD